MEVYLLMKCVACSKGHSLGEAIIHDPVQTYTQYMSPELIDSIAYNGKDPALDPKWRESGARDADEYAYWSRRSCGIACLQMVLAHFQLPVPTLVPLCLEALDEGCYVQRSDGGLVGLIYKPFTEFVKQRFGVISHVETMLSRNRLAELASEGALVMASVHREIRRPAHAAPWRGGHLVLVIGCESDNTVHFRNPSGDTDSARNATLPWNKFEPFFAMRGIAVFPPGKR